MPMNYTMSNLDAVTGLSSTAAMIRHTSLFKNRPTGVRATHLALKRTVTYLKNSFQFFIS